MKTMKTKIFTPIESMNPIYLGASDDELYESILKEHNDKTFAEVKEDGYRVQLHKKGDIVKGYTRSMNSVELDLFPELKQSLQNLPNCILDAELAGDKEIGHHAFNSVKKRFRHRINQKGIEKYLQSGLKEEFPLALRVFDTLYWENNDLVNQPLIKRRKYTENILESKIVPSTLNVISDSVELGNIFNGLVGEYYEGLVCKNPSSSYLPGKRTKDWIKLKRSETLDLVVLGVYLADGEISQILCGSYNPEIGKFETLAKVNAKREGMNKQLSSLLENKFLEKCPNQILLNPEIWKNKERTPDYFISPKKTNVVEVAAMNFNKSKNWHSCGFEDGKSYSLRIGWLKSLREDKKPTDASTTEQVKSLYENERR